MDHRAIDDAAAIDATAASGAAVRRRVDLAGDGDAEAAVAQTEHCRRPGDATARWFDLPDFLTWRATGATTARCAAPCASGPTSGTSAAGMRRTSTRSASAISPPTASRASARACASRASASAALDAVGRRPTWACPPARRSACRSSTRTPARSACSAPHGDDAPLERRLAMIAGTSACHLAVSARPLRRRRRLGPVLRGAAPRSLADRSRHLGIGRVPRPRAAVPSAFGRRPPIRSPRSNAELANARRGRDRGDGSRPTGTGSRTCSATALRSPIPTLTGGTAGVRMRDDSKTSRCWYSRRCRRSRTRRRHIVDALARRRSRRSTC